MNRQFQKEEIQKYVQRWQQLREEHGDQAVNVPEFAQLTKVIKYIQFQSQQQQQQQQPQQQQQQQRGMNPNQGGGAMRPGQGNGNQMFNGSQHDADQQMRRGPTNQDQFQQQMQRKLQQQQQQQQFQNRPFQADNGGQQINTIGTPGRSLPPGQVNPNRQMQFGGVNGMDSQGTTSRNPMMTKPNPNTNGSNTPVLKGPYSNQTPNQNLMQQNPRGQTKGGESPFTDAQGQLFKAQLQGLKHILNKGPATGSALPQEMSDFITNEQSVFIPNGAYIPTFGSQQPPPQVSNAPQVPIQQQQQQQQQQQPPQHRQQQQPQPPSQQFGMQQQHPMQPSPQVPKAPTNIPMNRNSSQSYPQGLSQQLQQNENNNLTPITAVQQANPIQQGQIPVQMSNRSSQPSHSPSDRPAETVESTKEGFQPVLLPPKPPVNIKELVPEHRNDVILLPVNKPNVHVDAFEVPTICDQDTPEIPYNALYSSGNRINFPSVQPNGIDMDDVYTNKEVLMTLQIHQEIQALEETIRRLGDEDPIEKEKATLRLARLKLLPYQKEIRGKLLSHFWFGRSLLPNSHPNFLAIFSTLSLDNVNATHEVYKHQLHTLIQAQNQKHRFTIDRILSCRDRKISKMNSRSDRLDRLSSKISSFHNQTAKEEQKKIEKMAKQRLQALKSNDEEAYLKLLDHTKDTRITHLLKQTNQFLDSLAHAVQSQQKETHTKVVQSGRSDGDEEITEESREKLDYYSVAHRIQEEVTKQPSILIGGTLKEYQIKGLQWMVSLFNNHLNGILADEMGLGKTIQTLSLLTYLVEVKKIPGPFLVIVPLSTLTNWNLEFEKWAPSVKKISYKGTPNQRKVLQADIRSGNFQILLTTYEYVIKDKALLSKIRWVHMIIDEGHRMKNANSKLSETLTHHYHSDYRLILTGTPLQNNLPELWALLNFVLPKIFNSVKSFDEWFNTPFANTGGQDKIELSEEETLLVIRRLHKVLRPFLLRRLKKDVEKDLPNKVEKVVKCKMSALQSKLYQQMLNYNMLFAGDMKTGGPSHIKNANNQIMQLRKICNHPFAYEEVESLINPNRETNDNIWRVSGKLELLEKILPKFKATGHRVLMFFQMTTIMDIMEDFLRLRGMKYMRLDGGTKSDERNDMLKLFNAPNSDIFCFLLSTRAGGLGLNLQTADTVIIFDTDWNPHQDLQAQDRAHRIGQKNEVRILRLITDDSVEEMILERAHAKLDIDGKVIQAGKFDNKSTSEEQEAMLRALIEKEEERRQKGSNEDDEELDDDEMNQIIARNDDEIVVFRKMDEERIAAMKKAPYSTRLFSEDELPEVYKKDPETFIKKDEVNSADYGRGARERKVTTYDDNLSEEQWLKQIDGYVSEDNFEDPDVKPKRGRGRPRGRPKKVLNVAAAPESAPDVNDTPDEASQQVKRAGEEREEDLKRAKSATPTIGSSVTRRAIVSRTRGRAKAPRGGGRGKRGRSLLTRTVPSVDPLSPEERTLLQDKMNTIFSLVMDYENDEGRRLSDMFLIKPSRKMYPDYYVLIKNPIALDTLKKRINNKSYTSMRDFLEDLHLMSSNAKIYNEEGSIVYRDAAVLESLALDKFRELSFDIEIEEVNKILDFQEFDQLHNLKPLAAVGNLAIKKPIDVVVQNNMEIEGSGPPTVDTNMEEDTDIFKGGSRDEESGVDLNALDSGVPDSGIDTGIETGVDLIENSPFDMYTGLGDSDTPFDMNNT